MVMAVVEDADAAGEIEYLSMVAGVDPAPFGVIGKFAAKAERGHQRDLAAVDVSAVEFVHLPRLESFAVLDGEKVWWHAGCLLSSSWPHWPGNGTGFGNLVAARYVRCRSGNTGLV